MVSDPKDFNSYGARRGNHEVMVRGTFANIRLRNLMVPGVEGGFTVHLPDGEQMTIFDASERYRKEGVPLIVIAGKEYGTGSSRDWAAKGTQLLGVTRGDRGKLRANPSQQSGRDGRAAAGVPARRKSRVAGAHWARSLLDRRDRGGIKLRQRLTVSAQEAGKTRQFEVISRVDTPEEIEYIRHGGILPFVLRELLRA